jgi:hypothetical protein
MRPTCRSEPCSRKIFLDCCRIQDFASKARSYKKAGRPHGGLLQRIHIIANRAEYRLDKLVKPGDVGLPADVEPCVVITP